MLGGRARVLCVDDEPRLLEGLRLHLRSRFDVEVAVGGEAGLAAVASKGPFAVVVSDMRMPGMSGAAFLARVRAEAPDTVRILLTGSTDLDLPLAVLAESQLFRVLSKPCPPETIVAAIEAGVHRYLEQDDERRD
jgi:DNA-binding NtrC family response regulator